MAKKVVIAGKLLPKSQQKIDKKQAPIDQLGEMLGHTTGTKYDRDHFRSVVDKIDSKVEDPNYPHTTKDDFNYFFEPLLQRRTFGMGVSAPKPTPNVQAPSSPTIKDRALSLVRKVDPRV